METDVKKYSVTAADIGTVTAAPVFHWMLNPQWNAGGLPEWGAVGGTSARDYYLRQSLYVPFHDFWAAAIGIAITKMASQAWEIKGDKPRIRNWAQQLLLSADGNQGWVSFLSRHLTDYLCTDNGAFIEVVRTSPAPGSPIVGLMHLDSLRVTRTGNPETPAIYRDTAGQDHQLKAHQILMLADMPSSAETMHGVGLCAASRAWGTILKTEAIERYIYEKVSGKRPLAVDLVNGISEAQMHTAVEAAKEDSAAKGQVTYMGAVIVPALSDVPITHTRINFAELPDGFDRKQELDTSLLIFADAIGLDPQDLQPLTGQALGTGAQSQVLHDKAQGKGLASWRQQLTHLFNQFVLPDAALFGFSENDLRDRAQRADISTARASAVGTLVEKGIITPAQAIQVLADEDELPEEFVPLDQTPAETISDTDQPESAAEQDQARAAQSAPAGELNAATKEAPGEQPAPFRHSDLFDIDGRVRLQVYRERLAALSRGSAEPGDAGLSK